MIVVDLKLVFPDETLDTVESARTLVHEIKRLAIERDVECLVLHAYIEEKKT